MQDENSERGRGIKETKVGTSYKFFAKWIEVPLSHFFAAGTHRMRVLSRVWLDDEYLN